MRELVLNMDGKSVWTRSNYAQNGFEKPHSRWGSTEYGFWIPLALPMPMSANYFQNKFRGSHVWPLFNFIFKYCLLCNLVLSIQYCSNGFFFRCPRRPLDSHHVSTKFPRMICKILVQALIIMPWLLHFPPLWPFWHPDFSLLNPSKTLLQSSFGPS